MASYFTFLKHPKELIASLFEAPPSLTPPPPAAVQSANQMAAVSDVTSVPHGMCGWVPTETGSADWVCQAFGQVMPGLVFFVSLIVTVVTIIFLIRYLSKCRRAATELRRLVGELEPFQVAALERGAAPALSLKILQTLEQSAERFGPIRPFTKHIQGAVVQINTEEVVLTHSIKDIAAKSREMAQWTGRSLADELPSWLTSIGLLTTFIAILLGLQHVKVMTNMEVQGIGGLVNGLSGKFFSSIVALSCALSVTIANHFCSEMLGHRWTNLMLRLEALLPHLSTEKMLLKIVRDQRGKNTES